MKKFTLIGVAALLATLNADATVLTLNGNNATNNNAAYSSGTNSVGVVTNNFQIGQVPGATVIYNTLAAGNGVQTGLGLTAALPSFTFNALGGYPNSLTAPTKNVSIQIAGALMATNATATAIVFRFAASDNGVNWLTNYLTSTFTVPVNCTTVAAGCVLTNVDVGGTAYIALQQIDNPGVAALTNIVLTIVGKPGL